MSMKKGTCQRRSYRLGPDKQQHDEAAHQESRLSEGKAPPDRKFHGPNFCDHDCKEPGLSEWE